MKLKQFAATFFAAAAMLAFAASARAVDGTIEINQAKVMAAGGFPYTIGASGSYRLTGNLTAPAGKDAIDVPAPNVGIDLNQFSIVGPGSSSNSTGINALGTAGVTVENGTVTGFGGSGFGIEVGNFGIVRNVHADANGIDIAGGLNTVIEGCTANNSTAVSTGTGINCSGVCVISGNTANGNPDLGIFCGGERVCDLRQYRGRQRVCRHRLQRERMFDLREYRLQ
jgi:hypothetical protein